LRYIYYLDGDEIVIKGAGAKKRVLVYARGRLWGNGTGDRLIWQRSVPAFK